MRAPTDMPVPSSSLPRRLSGLAELVDSPAMESVRRAQQTTARMLGALDIEGITLGDPIVSLPSPDDYVLTGLGDMVTPYDVIPELVAEMTDRLTAFTESPAMDAMRRTQETVAAVLEEDTSPVVETMRRAQDSITQMVPSRVLEGIPRIDVAANVLADQGDTFVGHPVLDSDVIAPASLSAGAIDLPPSPEVEHERRHREAMERRDALLRTQQAMIAAIDELSEQRRADRRQMRIEHQRDRQQQRRNLWRISAAGAFFAGAGVAVGIWQLVAS